MPALAAPFHSYELPFGLEDWKTVQALP
jgi:hypothetical protein